jgi:hypothetical protein
LDHPVNLFGPSGGDLKFKVAMERSRHVIKCGITTDAFVSLEYRVNECGVFLAYPQLDEDYGFLG